MKQQEIANYALDYLYKNNYKFSGVYKKEFIKVNRELNYKLLTRCEAIQNEFGEVTKKDVVLLIEAWLMSKFTNESGLIAPMNI